MEKLPKVTLLAACGGMPLYILLFLFVDRPVVGWLHAHHFSFRTAVSEG
jgi:hypothetical protein